MVSNRLLFNHSITQFSWLGGRRQLQGIALLQLVRVFPEITFILTVCDLGLTLDQELSLSQNVNLVSRSYYYQLRQLRVGSHSLSYDALAVFGHALRTSRIDHCCSILVGLPLLFWGD